MSQTTRGTSSSVGTYLMLGLIVLGFVALGAIFYLGSVNLCSTNCAATTTVVTSGSSTFTSTISSTTTISSSSSTTISTTTISSSTISSSSTTTGQTSNTMQACASGLTITIHVFNPNNNSNVANDQVSVVNTNGNPNYSASGITDAAGNFVYCGYPNVQYKATESLTGSSVTYTSFISNTSTETFQLPINPANLVNQYGCNSQQVSLVLIVKTSYSPYTPVGGDTLTATYNSPGIVVTLHRISDANGQVIFCISPNTTVQLSDQYGVLNTATTGTAGTTITGIFYTVPTGIKLSAFSAFGIGNYYLSYIDIGLVIVISLVLLVIGLSRSSSGRRR